jgi:hypothetical protein
MFVHGGRSIQKRSRSSMIAGLPLGHLLEGPHPLEGIVTELPLRTLPRLLGSNQVDEAVRLARDEPHVLDRRGTVDGAEEAVGEREAPRVGPVVGDVLLPILHVGVAAIGVAPQPVEAVHLAAVDRGESCDEGVIDPRGPVGRPPQGDPGAVARHALGGAVDPGHAAEHVVEGAVLLHDEDEVLDLRSRLGHGILGGQLVLDLLRDPLLDEGREADPVALPPASGAADRARIPLALRADGVGSGAVAVRAPAGRPHGRQRRHQDDRHHL